MDELSKLIELKKVEDKKIKKRNEEDSGLILMCSLSLMMLSLISLLVIETVNPEILSFFYAGLFFLLALTPLSIFISIIFVYSSNKRKKESTKLKEIQKEIRLKELEVNSKNIIYNKKNLLKMLENDKRIETRLLINKLVTKKEKESGIVPQHLKTKTEMIKYISKYNKEGLKENDLTYFRRFLLSELEKEALEELENRIIALKEDEFEIENI